jgi:hypothetical protein
MTRGRFPRTRMVCSSSLHPIATPAEAVAANGRGRGAVHPKAIVRSHHLPRTGQVRSEDHTRRCRTRLTLTLRDGPKTAANANTTLKWMSLPPRRRFDLLAAANVLRSSRNRTVLSRHTANSSHRTRGQLPQVIECPFARSSSSRSSHRPLLGSGLSAFRSPPERGDRGQDPRKTRFLVAGFHTRFVPPSPFSTTLAGCSSPSPPACFSRSRSWSLLSGKTVPIGGHPTTASPKTSASRDSPWRTFRHQAEAHRSGPESDLIPASRETCFQVFPGDPPTGSAP